MALNKNLEQKVAEKTVENRAVHDAVIRLLQGVDEGKQLKRILEPILKTV